YEATVEAMVRMKCSLDYYNTISEEESLKIRENIEMHEDSARGEMSLCAKLSRWIENTHRKQLESKLKIIRQLKGETTETYNLITKAGISRYTDHGELMAQLIQQMKLDRLGDLLKNHYEHLAALHETIIQDLRARRERWIQWSVLFFAFLALVQINITELQEWRNIRCIWSYVSSGAAAKLCNDETVAVSILAWSAGAIALPLIVSLWWFWLQKRDRR